MDYMGDRLDYYTEGTVEMTYSDGVVYTAIHGSCASLG